MIATALIAAVITSSVVGFTVPANGPAEDAVYPSVVRDGLSPSHQNVSDGTLRNLGHAICEDLDSGEATLDVTYDVMAGFNQESPTDPLAPSEAGYIVGASMAAYCPAYINEPLT